MTTTPDHLDAGGLLDLLRARGVRLSTDGTALHYDAPADALTGDILDAMRRLKPDLLRRLAERDAADADPDVERTGPASRGQTRMYRVTMASPNPTVLTIALAFTLRGHLDHAALQRALSELARRHPALRTRYAVRDGEVRQQVLAPRPVPLPVLSVPEAEFDDAIRAWASRPFDFHAEPAFRAALLRPTAPATSPPRAELVIAMHHSIADGWSILVLVRDLAELYGAALTGQAPTPPGPAADFLDYSRWERDHLADAATARAVRTWADEVTRDLEPLRLPTDRPRAAGRPQEGGTHVTALPPDLAAELTAYAARRDATPYAVLAAAVALLLHRLGGAPSIPLTASVANRPDACYDDVVGVFTNAHWLVVPVRGAGCFDELVDRAVAAVWRMLAWQSVPITVQTEALGPALPPDPVRVFFALHDMAEPVLRLPGLAPAPARDVQLGGFGADQSWRLRPTEDGGIALTVVYARALFDPETVATWVDRYVRLLRTVLARPDTALPDGRTA